MNNSECKKVFEWMFVSESVHEHIDGNYSVLYLHSPSGSIFEVIDLCLTPLPTDVITHTFYHEQSDDNYGIFPVHLPFLSDEQQIRFLMTDLARHYIEVKVWYEAKAVEYPELVSEEFVQQLYGDTDISELFPELKNKPDEDKGE